MIGAEMVELGLRVILASLLSVSFILIFIALAWLVA
jgi:hypothetical protein